MRIDFRRLQLIFAGAVIRRTIGDTVVGVGIGRATARLLYDICCALFARFFVVGHFLSAHVCCHVIDTVIITATIILCTSAIRTLAIACNFTVVGAADAAAAVLTDYIRR